MQVSLTSDPNADAAQRKLAAEIEKLQAETRLLRQPWRDPRGVLIPLLGALIGLGSWWQAHVKNQETEQRARLVEEDRNKLQGKVEELEAAAEQLRTRLAANVPAGGSVAAEVQAVDTIRRNLQTIARRDDGRPAIIGPVSSPDAPATAPSAPLATIYVQVANEAQRREWQQHSEVARELGYLVPGIEVVGSRAPDRTEVRYFRDTDEERRLAEQLVASLKERTATEAVARYVRGFEGKTRPRTLELWVAP
jgi:hypothetical protein